MTNDMQITTLAPCTVAYIRVVGEYGKNYEPATHRLYQWAGAHGLADGECLYIYLDSPEITPTNSGCPAAVTPLSAAPSATRLSIVRTGKKSWLRSSPRS